MQRHTIGKYDASGADENQFEPGSRGRVLKNLLGIKGKREMDAREWESFVAALQRLAASFDADHRFTAGDATGMHREWLGGIYPWAGRYRSVDLSKAGFRFAAARFIPQLMSDFEKEILGPRTPLRNGPVLQMADHLAVVHVELILVHPFRDGNGRVARMLAMYMGMQAGLPALDFGAFAGRRRKDYFAAVRAGLARDYEPMRGIMGEIVARTLRRWGVNRGDSSGWA